MKAMNLSAGADTTRKLYYEDSHLKECRATVLDITAGKHGFEVLLDQTVFFPEGGGQLSDTGTLNGLMMVHASEKEGKIWHRLSETVTEEQLPAIGSCAECVLDWSRRFERMQGHSGEHIVSGLVHHQFGYENVGFHMGEEGITLDFDGILTREDLLAIEAQANAVIWQNLPVETDFPDPQTLSTLEYRSKLEIMDQVRIVSIGENGSVDRCACCAPHVNDTGEIGQIRLLSVRSNKGGVRIEMLSGRKAYEYGRMIQNQIDVLYPMFSTKEEKVLEAVKKLSEERTRIYEEKVGLLTRYLSMKAEQLPLTDTLLCLFEDLQGDDLRNYANQVSQRNHGITALFGLNGNYILITPENSGQDVRLLQKELQTAFGARGGGKMQMVTGRITAERSAIEAFFQSWKM